MAQVRMKRALYDLSLFPSFLRPSEPCTTWPSYLYPARPVPLSYFDLSLFPISTEQAMFDLSLFPICPSFLFQEEQENLEILTKKHAALGLTRRHYEIFADMLVKTIGEFGQDDPDELNAWRCALEPAIAFIWKCQEEARAHDVDV